MDTTNCCKISLYIRQNIRHYNAMCRDADVVKNIGLKLQFSSWFSIHSLIHGLYRFYYQIKFINVSLLNLMFCIDLYLIEKVYLANFFSIHCEPISGLKLNYEKGISIQCFGWSPQQVSLRPLRILWCRMFWLWPIKITNNVYFQSCQLMFRCLTLLPMTYTHSYFFRASMEQRVKKAKCLSSWSTVTTLSKNCFPKNTRSV